MNAAGGERRLIVNADDFGQSPGINQGVIAAHERGIVTSASLMVRWPAARDAAAYARAHPTLDLGLHADFGEWAYRDETWVPVYRVVDTADAAAVGAELERQLAAFVDLVGAPPSHLDSHQHAHREEPVRSILRRAADDLRVPLRECDPSIRYLGAFYGQSGHGYPVPEAIGVAVLVALIERLPPGITELGCHPGVEDDPLDTMYSAERAREVQTLCDPRVRHALVAADVQLRSFRAVRSAQ